MEHTTTSFGIGVNIFVVRQNRILLGKRKNTFGAGTWCLPGGHLEFGESMIGAARRELLEETGLRAKALRFANIVNDRGPRRHYLEISFVATRVTGQPEVTEPQLNETWQWFTPQELPAPLFQPHKMQIELFFRGRSFSDDN